MHIYDWLVSQLSAQGITLSDKTGEVIVSAPWSEVSRFDSSVGFVYLKTTPKLLALESQIIQVLRNCYQASVPELLAVNSDLHCFVMKDAGMSLRSVFKKAFDPVLACQAAGMFASLQVKVAEDVEPLLSLGVPDWRPGRLSSVFQYVLSDDEFWSSVGVDGSMIKKLEAGCSYIELLCEQLSLYAIKPSLVQPDCNDNNMLINTKTGQITLIDVGEIVISHPFFSLFNYFFQFKKHHGISITSPYYQPIKTAAFQPFLQDETQEHVELAFDIIMKLWPVYDLLSQHRLIKACQDNENIESQGDKLIGTINQLLSLLEDYQ